MPLFLQVHDKHKQQFSNVNDGNGLTLPFPSVTKYP